MAAANYSPASPSPDQRSLVSPDQATLDMEKTLLCTKCRCYFDLDECVPRSLPCRHVICEFCLGKLVKNSPDVACHECGAQTTLNHGLNDVQAPVDRTMVALLRFLTPEDETQGDLGRVSVQDMLQELRSLSMSIYGAPVVFEESENENDVRMGYPRGDFYPVPTFSVGQMEYQQQGPGVNGEQPVSSPASPEPDDQSNYGDPEDPMGATGVDFRRLDEFNGDPSWFPTSEDKSDHENAAMMDQSAGGNDSHKKKRRNKRRNRNKGTPAGAATAKDHRSVTMNPCLARSSAEVVVQKTRHMRSNRCAICQRDLPEGSPYIDNYMDAKTVLKLACGHYYHHHCVVKMIFCLEKNSFKCPQCQQVFPVVLPLSDGAEAGQDAGDDLPEDRFITAGIYSAVQARLTLYRMVDESANGRHPSCWGCDYMCFHRSQHGHPP